MQTTKRSNVCSDLSNVGHGSGAAAILLSLIPEVGPILAACFGAEYGALGAYLGIAANHNGMTLHIYTIGNYPMAWIPIVKW